jgi:hypothetical protein
LGAASWFRDDVRIAGEIVAAVLLTSGLLAGPLAGATTTSPHITATPNNAMVNSEVTLAGHRFPPHQQLRLRICDAKTWVVTQKPCSKGAIHVTTGAQGRFTTTWKAALCPRADWPGHPVTEERCYIGVPTPNGVDTIALVGHVKVIVTYP